MVGPDLLIVQAEKSGALANEILAEKHSPKGTAVEVRGRLMYYKNFNSMDELRDWTLANPQVQIASFATNKIQVASWGEAEVTSVLYLPQKQKPR